MAWLSTVLTHIWWESWCSIWGHAAPPLLCLTLSTHLQISTQLQISTPYLNIYTQHYELRLGKSTIRNWHSFISLWKIGHLFFFIVWNGKWRCWSLEDRFKDPTIYSTEGGVCLYQLAAQPSNSGVHYTAQTATLEKSYIGQIENLILILTLHVRNSALIIYTATCTPNNT